MKSQEYAGWAYDLEQAPEFRGAWREKVFQAAEDSRLDVEIGTGNGFFFAHRALHYPERNIVGLEVKYKPLIQAIRRTLRQGSQNARMVRYNGRFLSDLFAEGEVDNVFIHHPDPWTRVKKHKKRLLTADFLNQVFSLQKPGSYLEFKTDSRDYFLWAEKNFSQTPYQIEKRTLDLHRSEWADLNFQTHFERLFSAKKVEINYALFRRN